MASRAIIDDYLLFSFAQGEAPILEADACRAERRQILRGSPPLF